MLYLIISVSDNFHFWDKKHRKESNYRAKVLINLIRTKEKIYLGQSQSIIAKLKDTRLIARINRDFHE